jgi:hypothetical protein
MVECCHQNRAVLEGYGQIANKETNNFTTLVLASTPLNMWALVYL